MLSGSAAVLLLAGVCRADVNDAIARCAASESKDQRIACLEQALRAASSDAQTVQAEPGATAAPAPAITEPPELTPRRVAPAVIAEPVPAARGEPTQPESAAETTLGTGQPEPAQPETTFGGGQPEPAPPETTFGGEQPEPAQPGATFEAGQPESAPPAATFGTGQPEQAQPGKDFGAEQLEEPQSADSGDEIYTAKVVDYDFVGYRRLLVQLDNGQVWRQIEGDRTTVDRGLRNEETFEVELWKAGIGGYRMRVIPVDRIIRVERLK